MQQNGAITEYKWVNFFLLAFFISGALYCYSIRHQTAVSVSCIHKQLTGVECATCGLTRGISAYLHGQPEQALLFNPHTFIVILFIGVQIIGRLVINGIFYLVPNTLSLRTLAASDICISTVHFISVVILFMV